MLYIHFTEQLNLILDALASENGLRAGLNRANITIEPPRDPRHGDISTNAAMVLAKPAGTNPRALADLLIPRLMKLPEVALASIAGPGFINLHLHDQVWRDELAAIHAQTTDYGRSAMGAGKRVNVEYVSANPTGPMHMGHCRGAVVGDALASLLEYAGYKVTREYYVNDAGGQVDVLARSVHLRYREALGEDIGEIPEGLYPGDYLKPIGRKLVTAFGDYYQYLDESHWLEPFKFAAVRAMMSLIRKDLERLGIKHDKFTYESQVHREKLPEAAEAALRARDLVYDGQLEAPKGEVDPDWEPVTLPLFRSTQFGDDQDRPIKKSNGTWTYFGADMAYHYQKAQSADMLIDIWGADHAGTVKRIKAAVAALTEGKTPFDVKLVQMVRLLNGGEPIKMSKRAGNFVTIADAIQSVDFSPVLTSIGVVELVKTQHRMAIKNKFNDLFKFFNEIIKEASYLKIDDLDKISNKIGNLRKFKKLLNNYKQGFDNVQGVINTYGKDVVRFTMLTRKADAQMDFDFAKVVEASKENPVFYVQYAHARIHSLARKAKELGLDVSAKPDLSLLTDDDLRLIKLAAQFPRIVESAATHYEPHRIAFYLYDLAAAFHAHWHLGNESPEKRILVVNNAPLTTSRLFMAAAIGQVIANGLLIMGVEAATEM